MIIACSELGRVGEVNEHVSPESLTSPGAFVINGYTYKSFGSRLAARNMQRLFPEAMRMQFGMPASWQSRSTASSSIMMRSMTGSNFIKNVILDNILPGDIYLKARELHFNSDSTRVCMMIKVFDQPHGCFGL